MVSRPARLQLDPGRALAVLGAVPAEEQAMLHAFDQVLTAMAYAASGCCLFAIVWAGVVLMVEGAEGRGAGRRLVLTDRGLALLARRDRAAVHAFVVTMARQARILGWELAQLDPPHRASRYFPHGHTRRAVHPDAFGVLRRDAVTWTFFLEWERRAVRPATMAARLAPYLRYYASSRPTDDHGAPPAVLIVAGDDLAATHFRRVAHAEMDRSGVGVPLWITHAPAVAAQGPLGKVWRRPGRWKTVSAVPGV